MNARNLVMMVVVAVLCVVVTGPAMADFTLSATQNWCDSSHLQGITLNGTGATTLVPSWDGTTVTYSPVGLNFNTYNLTCGSGGYASPPVTFDLGAGSISRGGVSGGNLTLGSGNYNYNPGKLTIQNATDIVMGDITCTGGYGGGGINITQTGAFSAGNISNPKPGGNAFTGNMVFQGTGALAISSIDMSSQRTSTPVELLTIRGYSGVNVSGTTTNHALTGETASGLNAGSARGAVTVTIDQIGAGGITLASGLYAYSADGGFSSITLSTTGPVSVGGILNATNGSWFSQSRPGTAISVSAGGPVTLAGLTAAGTNVAQNAATQGGAITLTTTGSIQINGDLISSVASGNKGGGNVTLTATGNINVTGTINLNGSGTGADGTLSMTSTGGKITVKDLDCSLFQPPDLVVPITAWVFNSGTGNSYITGTLSNFDVAHLGGTCVELSAPQGQIVWYDPLVPGNAYLNSATYTLTGGGLLEAPMVPEPAPLALMLLGLPALLRRRNG